ncbi:MAG: V-type ATP synthase subunit I [Spirochaetales bacterium]|nr:MAG: V-type ATP synthase subunit I [Spirochaetales bacterium]
MIAAMKRAFVVVVDREKREALKNLRKLGLVHLESVRGQGEAFEELAARKRELDEALAILSEYKRAQTGEKLGLRAGIDLANDILATAGRIRERHEEIASLSKEIERISTWGEFDPECLRDLAERGLPIRLAELPAKKLASLPADLDYLRLSEKKGRIKLALLAAGDRELPVDLVELRAPEKSLSLLQADLSVAVDALAGLKGLLLQKAAKRTALKKVLSRMERDLVFETLRSGIGSETAVAWLAGWVPAKDEKQLVEAAAKAGWALLIDEPQDDELPPTKVENNAVVRMIHPVLDFLGTVPNYREFDISLWFLLFFGLFFAMIFGDAGYGTLMLACCLFFMVKGLIKRKGVGDGLKLFLYLSGLTVAWGTITGSWFSLLPENLPGFLKSLAIEPIASWNPDASDNIKVLCFILGGVQLSIAHIKNIFRDFPKPKFLGQVGALALVLGMYFMALNLVVSADKYPIPQFGLYLILGGFTVNFIFGSWETGPIQAILDSLKNFISIFLGTVSFFADIVSYIRLWAVGLAGVAISQTVNGMASGLLRIPLAFIAGVLILFLGHGLNLMMGALSVVVHGVRLNILEFSTHMNMEWSGYRYEPFKETVDE